MCSVVSSIAFFLISGAILPNGEINWDCPCLGNLPNGPCGPSFKEAFTCWVENKDNEQGFAENCFENFTNWERCLSENKDIYRQDDDPPSSQKNAEAGVTGSINNFEDDSEIKNNQLTSSSASTSVTVNETRAIAAASTAPKT